MQIKSTMIILLSVSTLGLSGCSSMWNSVGNFSDYMAEKTSWISIPSLRGSQPLESVQTVDATIEIYETAQTQEFEGQSYDYVEPEIAEPVGIDEFGFYTPESAISYDSEGNAVIDTSPVPCPEGTYLSAENSCMMLE